MAIDKQTTEQLTRWLADEWGRSFGVVMQSMADSRPSAACDGNLQPYLATAVAAGSLMVEQELSLGPQCLIRMVVPEVIWRETGSLVLRAAGIEEVAREDALSTFHEILSQTLSGVSQAIGARLGTEVRCSGRAEKDSLQDDTLGLLLSLDVPEIKAEAGAVFLSATADLIEQLSGVQPPPQPVPPPPAKIEQAPPQPSTISKTFDLLLGVHLPVSVSFGKTSMMVKEVLKLTTGSIVELNRAVTEPVDIIVNNCVIARGDVVVVAGNYGVRVREIVSKEQRYQTGVGTGGAHGDD
jgi:flagellar motor switch protein FliN